MVLKRQSGPTKQKSSADGATVAPTTNNDHDIRQAVTIFANAVASQISTSMTYLHSTVTWAVTIFAGGIGAIIINDKFPNGNSQLLLVVLFVVLAHLFVRTAKAYLNVMRFTALDKYLLTHVAKGDYKSGFAMIQTYYVNWTSPLSGTTVIAKTLFELGFFYIWTAIVGVFIYTAYLHPTRLTILMLVAHAAAAIELYFALLKSPYLKRVQLLPIAVEQR